jgi:ABC-type Zn uptake system ZnuABC Zn-binding protein ZnuA
MFAKTKFLILTIFTILILVAAQCGADQPKPTALQTEVAEGYEEEHLEDEAPADEEYEVDAEMSPLAAVPLAPGEKLSVLATTSIVGDIVKNVGGEPIDLEVLLPLGTDPHAFDPTPRDLARVADADVIIVNGLGLETFLAKMLKSAGSGIPVVVVSKGVETRHLEETEARVEEPQHDEDDPHVWLTPANAKVFVDNIEHALSALDPAHTATYQANAAAYRMELETLDNWVQTQIDMIPPENRQLVTDHDTFGYYAERYGLEMVGAVLPGYSTISEPSAQELAALQNAIKQYGVKAVFVGSTVNPVLAKRIAEDTGIQLVLLYTGSLGEAGSGAATYVDYIRYNTQAIVEALK